MIDFKLYNDYELIYYIKEGSEKALNFFILKYEPLIRKTASYFKADSDKRNDLCQEGFLILLNCINKYNEYINCSFYSYFQISLRRRFYKLLSNEYYSMPIVEDEILYNNMAQVNNNLSGKAYLKDELEIELFDNCIMSNMSLKKFSLIKGINYKKVIALDLKIREKLKKELNKIYNINDE